MGSLALFIHLLIGYDRLLFIATCELEETFKVASGIDLDFNQLVWSIMIHQTPTIKLIDSPFGLI